MSETLDDVILAPIESAFDMIGAMEGEFAPFKRAVIGGVFGAFLSYGLKPSFAFDDDGNALPFALTAPETAKQTTYCPAWLIVALPAIICGVLI